MRLEQSRQPQAGAVVPASVAQLLQLDADVADVTTGRDLGECCGTRCSRWGAVKRLGRGSLEHGARCKLVCHAQLPCSCRLPPAVCLAFVLIVLGVCLFVLLYMHYGHDLRDKERCGVRLQVVTNKLS